MWTSEKEIKMREEWKEAKRKFEKEIEGKLPLEQRKEYQMAKKTRERLSRGEIIDPFLENWMNTEISAARKVLLIGMALTALIRGQVVIWLIMYIAYRGRVKKVKEEAWNENLKQYGRYLTDEWMD